MEKDNAKSNDQVPFPKGDTTAEPKSAWTPAKHIQDHQEAHEVSSTLLLQATDTSHVPQRKRWLVVLQFAVFVTFDRINNPNSGLKLK